MRISIDNAPAGAYNGNCSRKGHPAAIRWRWERALGFIKKEDHTMKKIAALLLALAMMMTCVAALADTLVMATNASFPPYEYYDG